MPRPIQARIDRAALRHNYLLAKGRVAANGGAKAWAVVAREALAEPRISSWAFTPCTGAISSDVADQMTEATAAASEKIIPGIVNALPLLANLKRLFGLP